MTRAFICGCAGLSLSQEEISFLREARPWGTILFKRNVASRAQLSALTADIRGALGTDAPILVDQEGGRVQRLGPPVWRAYPAAAAFERLGLPPEETAALARLSARLIAHDLREVGIDVDCLPVLDTPVDGSHNIIGDRAYSRVPTEIARLGRAAAEGLLDGGVLPVIKHIPGHGRARADSHLELPVVEASRAELEAQDFIPFRADADLPLGMTAHVVYRAIDPDHPGTLSRAVIEEIIRGLIGFDGLLMTDDLSMKALSGGFRARAEGAIAAGCDVVLHCNGDLAEARAVAEGAGDLAGRALERARAAKAKIAAPKDFDPVDGARQFDTALAAGV
ncbi:beta-N-acetylhexosaminidase [Methylosinus sporium]|uniref:beta-N-acetylhexosaminidase n=1 Tax=Methylosinus sporium TaxID=428 RepID=A0A549T1F1_METSR|nr:beta-N-acetylhexosaminidase [Methylosinus sporium]MBU3887225.1 beta-N-acetylhexosaminidase [Methylosinus sp. KRF6]TRL35712.1 beta-N-acetylhexosaminidase [Methylosinus sporium]